MKESQWYPGNMARAITQLRQDLKVVDLVVELLDARVPISSRNPALIRLLQNKKHLMLLHKADRGENAVTERWLAYFKSIDLQALAFSVQVHRHMNDLLRYLKQQEYSLGYSRLKRPLRLMVVGIPNVGKSTLINCFVSKAVTKTANQPGITRGRQWVRILPGVELLDTPGVLWPKLTEETALPLAVVGAIPPSRLDVHKMALWLLDHYIARGKEKYLTERYRDLQPGTVDSIFEQIGFTYGCLQAEGKIDFERTAMLILRDFQSGALGRLSLEEPPG
ncbi:MAG TPA: ribosome biogenesis GTPase YlqF [Candidatus Limnocylindrales bacterium]|nr:ribosome biogenesis GTPase YlqF [Candidatus Limnocylindrales bacterium]